MKAITNLWSRLTEPHPSITEPEARHRARLTGTLLVALFPLGLIALTVLTLVDYLLYDVFDPILVGLEYAVIFGILLCYLLGRTPHAAYSARLFVGILFIGVFASIVQAPQYKTSAIILPLPLLIGGLILSRRASRLLFFATLAGTLLLPALGVDWEAGDYLTILATEIVFGIIILLSSGIREQYSRQAEEHRRDLEERAIYAEERAREISESLTALAALDFSQRTSATGQNDVFDALAVGVNMLGEELAARVEALRESEEKYVALFEKSSIPAALTKMPEGIFAEVNDAFERAFGFTRQEVVGKTSVEIGMARPEERAQTYADLERFDVIRNSEKHLLTKSGEARDCLISVNRIAIHGQDYVITTIQDITERKRAEEKIFAALKEKESLLREVHHRVKNNLQVISSILNMQMGYLKDESARVAFKEMQSRVRSMAMVHERLYRSGDLAALDFAAYVESLTGYLARALAAVPSAIALKLDIPPLTFGLDTAVPLGLIVAELVSNAFKHAFPDGRAGEIRIALRAESDTHYTLVVGNDGVRFPADFDWRNSATLGLELVQLLVKQLNGTIALNRSSGTEFKITFSEPEYANRGE